MSKESSDKYYQKVKEWLQKVLVNGINICLRNKKVKEQQYGHEIYKKLPEVEKEG